VKIREVHDGGHIARVSIEMNWDDGCCIIGNTNRAYIYRHCGLIYIAEQGSITTTDDGFHSWHRCKGRDDDGFVVNAKCLNGNLDGISPVTYPDTVIDT